MTRADLPAQRALIEPTTPNSDFSRHEEIDAIRDDGRVTEVRALNDLTLKKEKTNAN